jgi:hypothetical protein
MGVSIIRKAMASLYCYPGDFVPPDPLSPFARGDPYAPLRSGGLTRVRSFAIVLPFPMLEPGFQ